MKITRIDGSNIMVNPQQSIELQDGDQIYIVTAVKVTYASALLIIHFLFSRRVCQHFLGRGMLLFSSRQVPSIH